MKLIKRTDLTIDTRIRQHYDPEAIGTLADSINRLGLFHAPVLVGSKLVIGGRRIQAIDMMRIFGQDLCYQGERIPNDMIPYTELGDFTEEQIMEAELEENLKRENLTIQEESAAQAELHRLRLKQNPTQTLAQTADEIHVPGVGPNADGIRDALLIADNLNDPEVAKAKNKKEAIKIITRKAREVRDLTFAQEFQQQDSYGHELHQGMMEKLLHTIPESSIDVILTDPPYGIGADSFAGQEGTGHDYEDSLDVFISILRALGSYANYITKEQAHAYIFCDFKNFPLVSQTMTEAGFKVWPRPLIWSKGNGLLPEPEFGPRNTYECILFANKGKKPVRQVELDVISINTLQHQRRGAEKPAELYHSLLRRSVTSGDTVLDVCCGLGPIFPAAHELNCRAIGFELDPIAVGYATQRIGLTLAEDAERRAQEIAAE